MRKIPRLDAEDGLVSTALQFTGWYSILSDMERSQIYSPRRINACETRQFLQSILYSIGLFVGELLDQLVTEINNSDANDNSLGDVLCAITILYRFLNRHGRGPGKLESPGTTDIERIMASTTSVSDSITNKIQEKFESEVYSLTERTLTCFQIFRKTYGARFCLCEEANYQPWLDLVEIQSQPKLSVTITIEKENALLLEYMPDETLNARSFTQVLDSRLSSVEEYFADLGLNPRTRPDLSDQYAKAGSLPSYLLSEQFSNLQIELDELNYHTSSDCHEEMRHQERPMYHGALKPDDAGLLFNDKLSSVASEDPMQWIDFEGLQKA